jgi:putative radical SAM enzyme (TIGR03279 family)
MAASLTPVFGGDFLETDIGHLIAAIQPDSIADELGIRPGDRLMAIDEQPVRDVFDYQTRQMAEQLLLTIHKADNEVVLLDIEKDEDEDLGLTFANPMLDDCRNCHNHCIFCFIDQLPEGLRSSLYLKDDDLRLSFLTGNYVTLTNTTPTELDRIIAYHLSPLNISVHATETDVRCKMMRNTLAGDLMPKLKLIAAAGIRINAQIVLVPDYNDGAVLDQTIHDLASLVPAIQSIAIVPVGITRYRQQNQLTPLRALTPTDARMILEKVAEWQKRLLDMCGSRVLFAADELYLCAGLPIPPASEYEDYPQLENGVGMLSLFMDDLERGISDRMTTLPRDLANAPARVLLVTGTAAGPALTDAAASLSKLYGLTIETMIVANWFFGETITVAGLLTGQDILAALMNIRQTGKDARTIVLIPENQLRSGTQIFLDDETIDNLAALTGMTVLTVAPDAPGLLQLLDRLTGRDCDLVTEENRCDRKETFCHE